MFKTIKTWIHRIKDYEYQQRKKKNAMIHLRDQINVLHGNLVNHSRDYQWLRVEHKKLEKEHESVKNALNSMVNILSEGTWKEGDNMMEAIETAQERKYLKEHAEDFLMIMNGNVPELAARELFEYFEVEVPDGGDIEIQTAKKLYDLWIRASWDGLEDLGVDEFEELSKEKQQFFITEANKLWIIP